MKISHDLITRNWEKISLAVIILLVVCIGLMFSVSDTLPGLFDDSAIYLIAAEIYSPYGPAPSSALLFSYSEYRHLPPGFPFLLAITGTNNSLESAHLMVLLLLVLSALVYYMLGKSILGKKGLSMMVLLMFLCTPAIWIESLKIASENLYMMLSLWILLITLNKNINDRTLNLFLIALLLCLLILTRTIGWSLFMAFILSQRSGFFHQGSSFIKRSITFILAFTPLYIWIYISSELSGSYGGTASWYLERPDPLYTLANIVKLNINAFFDAWIQATTLTHIDGFNPGSLIAHLLLLLSGLGLIERRRYIDGIYLIVYLSVIIIWPYPHDMTRFIYPVFPLFLIYIVVGSQAILRKIKKSGNIAYIICLMYMSITLPSSSFVYHRYVSGKSVHGYDISHLPTLYYEPHAGLAFLTSVEAMHYMKFLPKLKKHVPPEALILTLKPELVTLISGLRANQLPSIKVSSEAPEFMEKVFEFNADYILLSKIIFPSHPMGTDLMQVLSPYTEIVTQEYSPVIKDTSVILLKMKNQY